MSRIISISSYAIVWMIVLVLTSADIHAQTICNDFGGDKVIGIEILKPAFGDEVKTTFSTSTVFITAHLPIGKETFLVGEIPFAHAEFTDFGNDLSSTDIGNVYVGIEGRVKGSRFIGELGFRLPLVTEGSDATFVGGNSDMIDRMEAFVADVFSVHYALNYIHEDQHGVYGRLRGGISGWFFTVNDVEILDSEEAFFTYGGEIGYNSGALLRFGAGINGRMIITEDVDTLGDRTFHQLFVSANVKAGNIQPGISMRIPIDEDYRDLTGLDYVIGFDLAYLAR